MDFELHEKRECEQCKKEMSLACFDILINVYQQREQG